jgi:predicted ATP-dependent serine protease
MQIFKVYQCIKCRKEVYEQWYGSGGRCRDCNSSSGVHDGHDPEMNRASKKKGREMEKENKTNDQ